MNELESVHAKLDEILAHVKQFANGQGAATGKWVYLVERPHPWRRQLSIKGRNLTVGQLMGTLRANNLSMEQAAEAFDLPLEAIREAAIYSEQNCGLIELEAAEERSRLARKGHKLEPDALPR
jgi:uncharacterized protein (DUF433 family)